jgi:hypothetical protein
VSALVIGLLFAAQVEVFDIVVVEGETPGPRVRTVEDALRPPPSSELSTQALFERTGFRRALLDSASQL